MFISIPFQIQNNSQRKKFLILLLFKICIIPKIINKILKINKDKKLFFKIK